MDFKICSRRGCNEEAKHKRNKTVTYCDKHFVWSDRKRTSKSRNKTFPSIEEFETLWKELINNKFHCLVCRKKMIIKSLQKGLKGCVVSLQHWKDGSLGLICTACNTGHGHSKLGDDWKHVPKNFKYCPACDKIKNKENFGKNRSRSNGLTDECKLCNNKRSKDNRA